LANTKAAKITISKLNIPPVKSKFKTTESVKLEDIFKFEVKKYLLISILL